MDPTTVAPSPSLINKISTYETVGQNANPPMEQSAQSEPSNPGFIQGNYSEFSHQNMFIRGLYH